MMSAAIAAAVPVIKAVGTWFAANSSWLAPVASAGASIYSAKKTASEASKRAEKADATYNAMRFPEPTAVAAQATQNRGALGQARTSSYQNLANNLAARGFGPGSGLMARGGRAIEGDYLKSLGNMATELTKFQNTPLYAPQVTSVPSGTEAAYGKAGSLLDTASGYMMMSNLLKPKTSTPKTPGVLDEIPRDILTGEPLTYNSPWFGTLGV